MTPVTPLAAYSAKASADTPFVRAGFKGRQLYPMLDPIFEKIDSLGLAGSLSDMDLKTERALGSRPTQHDFIRANDGAISRRFEFGRDRRTSFMDAGWARDAKLAADESRMDLESMLLAASLFPKAIVGESQRLTESRVRFGK